MDERQKNKLVADCAIARLKSILIRLELDQAVPIREKEKVLGCNYFFRNETCLLPANFRTNNNIDRK